MGARSLEAPDAHPPSFLTQSQSGSSQESVKCQ